MRRVGNVVILLLVLLTAHATFVSTRYATWSSVTKSQLLTNDDEAFLFIWMRQTGWQGSDIGYGWQIVRNYLGAATQTIDAVESLYVLRYENGEWTTRIMLLSRFLSHFYPVDWSLYVGRGDPKHLERWTGAGSEPVSESETVGLNLRWRMHRDPGNVWSSRSNVVTFSGPAPRRVKVPRHPITLVITTDFLRGTMQVDSEAESGERTRIWSKNEGHGARFIDERTYERAFRPKSANAQQ